MYKRILWRLSMREAVEASFYIMIFIFLGTLSGGVAVTLFTKVFHKNSFYLNVFCGGILAGILGFDLIPELMSNYRPVGIMAGISLGIFFMLLMDRFLHNSKHNQIEYQETFMLLFLALLFHSVPTGLALGINFQDDHFQEPVLLGAILIHHIPEGMVMMVSVLYSKMKLKHFWIFCFLISFAVGINTFLGIILDFQSLKLRTMFMGVAIGTLGYVTFYEVLWKGLKKHLTIKMLMAGLLGILFLRLYLELIPFNH
jgi:zinc transporter, ZIP family